MPTGLFVSHPLTGNKIEVWIGNYVLMSSAKARSWACRATNEAGFAFAGSTSAVVQVIDVEGKKYSLDPGNPGTRSRRFASIPANMTACDFEEVGGSDRGGLKSKGLGDNRSTWRLREWGVSRQRYWGCPIPIVHCARCGDVPVRKTVAGSAARDCVPDGSGNPLTSRADFLNTDCPQVRQTGPARDPIPWNFVDSSWYFCATPVSTGRQNGRRAGELLAAVDQYIGGIEHANPAPAYSRFWTKVMRDFGFGETRRAVHAPV